MVHLLVPQGVKWASSLRGVRVRVCAGVWPEGCLRWFAHLSGGVRVCAARQAQYSAFAPDTLWQLGFFSLSISFCPYFALTCRLLFLVPCAFFVFCCSRRHLSRCKHWSKGYQVPGPSLSQAHVWSYFPPSPCLPSKDSQESAYPHPPRDWSHCHLGGDLAQAVLVLGLCTL